MIKYASSILALCLSLVLTSCDQTKQAQSCSRNPNIGIHVDLNRYDPMTPEIFQGLIETCKTYGSVKVVDSEDLSNNEPKIFVSLSVFQLQEGFLPEFGKELPVYKVLLWAKDWCERAESPSSMEADEYIGIRSNPEETSAKIIASFNHLLSSFDKYYKKQHPDAANPIFYIENVNSTNLSNQE